MASSPRQQVDKLVIGTNDTSQDIGTPDKSPTGTLVANGPVVFGNVKQFGNDYSAVLNVSSDSCEQIPFDQQPKLDVKLAGKFDGNVKIEGDKKTDFALEVSGGSNQVLKVHGDAIFTAISPQLLSKRFTEKADTLPSKSFDITKIGLFASRHISNGFINS